MSSETASVHLSTYRCCWLADTNRFSRTDVKNKNLQICLKAKHLFPKRYRTVLAGFSCCTSSVISSVSDSSLFYSAALLKPLINNSSRLHSNRPGDGSSYSERESVSVSSPSSFRKSLLKRRPLGSLPMKRCTYSVPWSWTAMAYFSGFTHDCRQNGTLVSPTVCLKRRQMLITQDETILLFQTRSCISVCYEALEAAFLA